MKELVKLVSQKTGLSEDISRVAVETVISYLKQKLPALAAGQIDSLLGSSAPVVARGVMGSLGGLFDKK